MNSNVINVYNLLQCALLAPKAKYTLETTLRITKTFFILSVAVDSTAQILKINNKRRKKEKKKHSKKESVYKETALALK